MLNGIIQKYNILDNKKQTYQINGNKFSVNEIVEYSKTQLSRKHTEDWEKELYQFICSWFNDNDYINVFTSGSTGTAKEIKIGKQQMIESAKRTISFYNLKQNDRVLLCLPISGIAGKMMIVRAFTGYLNLITVKPQRNPLKGINKRIDFVAMTAYQVFESLQYLKETNNIKQLLIGGGTIPPLLEQEIQLLNTSCFASFGMTETITHIAIRKINGYNKQDYFTCLPDIKISTDKRNCLCIKAPYLEETIVTNDIVEIKDNNNFYWLGRYDNIVNSGGIKIYPEQVEHKLNKFITRKFFITSLPDNSLGEKLVLVIEGKAFGKNELKELKVIINSLLAKYHQPKEIIFIDRFLMTESNKIKRRETTASIRFQ